MNRNVLGASLVITAAIALWFAWPGDRAEPRRGGSLGAAPLDRRVHTAVPGMASHPVAPRDGHAIAADGPLRIEGQVVGPDGAGVGGAQVMLSSGPPRRVVSEADGSFAFEGLASRTYAITATAGELIGGPVALRVTTDSDPVVVRLGRGGALAIRVVNDAGVPIAAAAVELVDATARAARTDAAGQAMLAPLRPGAAAVTVSADGYAVADAIATIGAGATEQLTVTLHEGYAASGRVVDARGQGIPRVEVSTAGAIGGAGTGARTRTDDAGRFTISGLGAGTHTLLAIDGEHAPVAASPIAIVDRSIAGLEITMTDGGALAGVVVDPDARPIAHATVRIAGGGGRRGPTVARELTSDERGRFEARGLPRTAIQAQAESDRGASDPVDVDLTDTPAAEVKLTLAATGVIAGVVVDGDGGPMPEIQVTAFRQDDAPGGVSSPTSTTTDGSGAFALRGLRAGVYRLFATSSNTAARNPPQGTPAIVGARDVRIALIAAGGVRGSVQLGGRAPAQATVQLGEHSPVPVVAGRFEIEGATPGRHDLAIRGPQFAELVVRGIAIDAGRITDLGAIAVTPGPLEPPRGTVRLSVGIAARSGTVDGAQVFLFRGEVAATTQAQLAQAALQGSLAGTARWRGGGSLATFDDLVPGPHSVCAVPFRGDPEAADQLAASCKSLEVAASPVHQSVVHEVPAIAPVATR